MASRASMLRYITPSVSPRDKIVDINSAILFEIQKYQKGIITREQLDTVIKEKLLELKKDQNESN